MDTLFWWVGCVVVSAIFCGFLFMSLSVLYCWLSTAYTIWKGYVNVHEAHPEIKVIADDFQEKYGKYWKLVLFLAFASQYKWIMQISSKTYKTEWFTVNLRELSPKIVYHVHPESR